VERAAVNQSGIVAVDGPCPPGFGPFVVSSGFYHRIALALPFGLASTHAGVWQCRPAVTLSGRLTYSARSRASVVPSFAGPLHQPEAGIPAGTDEMFDVLHLLSQGASWRTIDYYEQFKATGNQLASESCTERQLQKVLDELYPSGTADTITDRTRNGRELVKERIVDLFLRGDTQGNAPGSKWAAVNAIVEYGDWLKPIRQGGERFARAVDDGAQKTRALELVSVA